MSSFLTMLLMLMVLQRTPIEGMQVAPHPSAAGLSESETAAVHLLEVLNTAERVYIENYGGFACRLGVLGPPIGLAGPDRSAAGLLDSAFASGQKAGYMFELRCADDGKSYRANALPDVNTKADQRSFCSDETGDIMYAENGTASSCLRSGRPISDFVPKPFLTNEQSATRVLRDIHRAQMVYSTQHKTYTCHLSDLIQIEKSWLNLESGLWIAAASAPEKNGGYRFELKNCDRGNTRYQVTVAPPPAVPDGRVLCTNETGMIVYGEDSDACLAFLEQRRPRERR